MPHDMESAADEDVQGTSGKKRLITGLTGSMLNDCSPGSEMQCSAMLTLLHEVAMREGHLRSTILHVWEWKALTAEGHIGAMAPRLVRDGLARAIGGVVCVNACRELGLHRESAWLRDAVPHQLPRAYALGTQVDRIVHDLRRLRCRMLGQGPTPQAPSIASSRKISLRSSIPLRCFHVSYTLPHERRVLAAGLPQSIVSAHAQLPPLWPTRAMTAWASRDRHGDCARIDPEEAALFWGIDAALPHARRAPIWRAYLLHDFLWLACFWWGEESVTRLCDQWGLDPVVCIIRVRGWPAVLDNRPSWCVLTGECVVLIM